MNRIVSFLCAVSGTRKDALARAPEGRASAATIGFVMLVTATIACMTMGYALHRAFVGDYYATPVAVVGGLLWGSFVLAVDRLLLMGIDKLGGAWKLTWQFLIRGALAVVIGVAISKPVVLRIAQTILDREIHDEKRTAVTREKTENAKGERLDEKESSVAALQDGERKQEARLQKEPDSFEYTDARDDLRNAITRADAVSVTNGGRIAAARRQFAMLEASVRDEDQRQLSALERAIARWQTEIANARSAVSSARERLADAERRWRHAESAKLTALKTDLDGAQKDASAAVQRVTALNAETDIELAQLLRTNLVNEYTTMKRIEKNPKHPDAQALLAFEHALDALFILFELTPLLAKVLSRKGPLDYAVNAVEEDDHHRINSAANATALLREKQTEMVLAVNDRALEVWRDTQLQRLQQTPTLTTKALAQIQMELAQVAA